MARSITRTLSNGAPVQPKNNILTASSKSLKGIFRDYLVKHKAFEGISFTKEQLQNAKKTHDTLISQSKISQNELNKPLGIVFYVKTEKDQGMIEKLRNPSHNVKILKLKADLNYMKNLFDYIENNMTKSTTGHCFTMGGPKKIRLLTQRGVYCVPADENYIVKYTGNNKMYMNEGDTVEFENGEWIKQVSKMHQITTSGGSQRNQNKKKILWSLIFLTLIGL